jgi:hypothetical protein
MKRLAAACIVTTFAAVPHGTGAAGVSRLDCAFEVHLAFTPGISPQMEAIHIASPQPGTLSCTGTWSGREATGRGLVTFDGRAVGDCAISTIDAVLTMEHPLAGGGRLHIVLPLRSGRVGVLLYGTSMVPDRPASVIGAGRPDPGQDCTTTPITAIAAEGHSVVGPWS